MKLNKYKWFSVLITSTIAWGLTSLVIYYFREYGVALFILIPLLIGANSVVLYRIKEKITYGKAWRIGFLTLGIYLLGLLLFAFEGIICIVMYLPIGILLTWIGSCIGYAFMKKSSDNAPKAMLLIIATIPIVSFVEKNYQPDVTSVVTAIEINAPADIVWKNVIEFPKLDSPTEFIFSTGIAYPTDAQIQGTGVGAVRYCNFTTGSFVEPITLWNEPHLLKFDVMEQPQPMKEISFWDINAPHLHDYFVSKQGQFKLTQLPNGNTLLEGTTWYYHNIKPTFYWRLWSNYIIHQIHLRVLNHIKKISEKELKIHQ